MWRFLCAALLFVAAFRILFGSAVWLPVFHNVARPAGLTAVMPNGGEKVKRFIIETTGSGAAVFDYDNDGLPDLFLVSGEGGTNRLYHNEGHGLFHDVTKALGLVSSGTWGQGVCAADYDNDGFTDLFVTNWGQNHLYRNIGGKRFEDVTIAAHLAQDRTRYNTGCAFLDIDNDGHLDLFIANYLKFDLAEAPKPGENPYCFYRGLAVACGPRGLPFDRNILYRSNGDGTFADISEASGVAAPVGHYGLGVVTGDFNDDGLTDIYVACDRTPSLLYINQGHGRFAEEGLLRGVALDQHGRALSGMGVAAADYAGDGHLSIFRSNFSDEMESLYRNRGEGNFDEVTLPAGLGTNTRFVGWGVGFFDFDNDGWPDLLLVNGHVFPEVEALHTSTHYKDRAILYRNLTNGTFEDISERAGPGMLEPHSARGAAFGDIDNDGSIEVLVNNQNEAPSLLKLASRPVGNWIVLQFEGTRSNRSGIGARVKLSAAGHTQMQEVRSGGSYLSHNDLRLHFGIANAKTVDRIDIVWPSGQRQSFTNVVANRIVTLREGR
ncbi:MAG: hypothetical protein JWP63_3696 [Candidatus Solibacter sp.]|nr:hypothetical protein [Candidatus Solibacter sp.]